MEKKQDKLITWFIVIGVITALLSCALGAAAGGLTGYVAGRIVAVSGVGSGAGVLWDIEPEIEEWHRVVPMPDEPGDEMPMMPFDEDMPEFRSMMPGGALVVSVVEGSPAERAGLVPGDVIIEVDGIALDEESLSDVISEYESGDSIEMLVWRAGDEIDLDARLQRDPDKGGDTPWLGITYRDISGFSFRRGRD